MRRRRARARPDRQPRPSGCRRLDAAAEPAQLDRFMPAWRRHHDGVSGRSSHARSAARHRRNFKAMAITAQRCFSNFRANGVKVHAGAPVIEPGMQERDFEELATAGIRFLGEVGLGGVEDGRPRARWSLGRANMASTARIIPAVRRFQVPGLSTRISCSRRTPTSSATSTAATRRCPTIRSSACAKAANAVSNSYTTATNARRS